MQVARKADNMERLQSDPFLARTLDELITGVENKEISARQVPPEPVTLNESSPNQGINTIFDEKRYSAAQPNVCQSPYHPTPNATESSPVPVATKSVSAVQEQSLDAFMKKQKEEKSALLATYKKQARKELPCKNVEENESLTEEKPAVEEKEAKISYESLPCVPLSFLLKFINNDNTDTLEEKQTENVMDDDLTESELGLLKSLSPQSEPSMLAQAIRNAFDGAEKPEAIYGMKEIVQHTHVSSEDTGIALKEQNSQENGNIGTQFMQWLYRQCSSFMERGSCSDVYVEFDGKVMSQRCALEDICENALFVIDNHSSRDSAIASEVAEREQRTARLWSEILPIMISE